MKRVKILSVGWIGLAVFGVAFFTSSAQAVEHNRGDLGDLYQIGGELELLKDQADDLRAEIETVRAGGANDCDQGYLEAQLAATLAIEADAHAQMEAAIAIAAAWTEPHELFIKYFIMVTQWHAKVVASVSINITLIVEIWEECAFAPGVDDSGPLQAEAYALKAARDYAHDTLLPNAEAAANAADLYAGFAAALVEQQAALDTAQDALAYAQGETPSLWLLKWVVIYGHWHAKVIHWYGIIHVTIIEGYEVLLGGAVMDPAQQSVADTVDDAITFLRTQEDAADALIPALGSPPVDCAALQDLFDDALAIEKEAIADGDGPNEYGLRTALTAANDDGAYEPCLLLQKKVILVEAWFQTVVIDVSIIKWLVIYWEEDYGCTQPSPESEIDYLKGLRADLDGFEADADHTFNMVRHVRDGERTVDAWHSGLETELSALDVLEEGVDVVQALPGPYTERLKKAIGIHEFLHVRVVLEVCLIKIVIIRIWEGGVIPAVTTWGLVVMTLLGLAVGTVMYRRWNRVPA